MSTKQPDETQARWYVVNKDGMATLCADQADAEQEAKDAQEVWPRLGPHRAVQLVEASFDSHDMATAAAQGFRDGQSAQIAVAAGWIQLPGTLPEPGTPVLLNIGKKYPIRAMWAAKHTIQAADDDTDWGEYVETDDMYYAPEGWYEWNECEDNHWRVTATPTHWRELPPPPSSAKGVEPVARLEIGKTQGGVSLTHIAEPAAFQLPEGMYALYTTPQPTQAQAERPNERRVR